MDNAYFNYVFYLHIQTALIPYIYLIILLLVLTTFISFISYNILVTV